MKTIAVIEDDVHIGNILEESLQKEGYQTCRAYSGTEAKYLLKDCKPDLILLDLMLPGIAGEELLLDIRNIPVIVMSAKAGIDDKVTALLGGAADYITKPFSLMVLRARVSVQLRDKEAVVKDSKEFDGFEFYFDRMEFFKNREPIELSKTEQKLLRVLFENKGKVLKREYLIDEVWQGDTEFVDAHALTVAIKRLRDKLEDDVQKPKYIKTVYGIGYTWR